MKEGGVLKTSETEFLNRSRARTSAPKVAFTLARLGRIYLFFSRAEGVHAGSAQKLTKTIPFCINRLLESVALSIFWPDEGSKQ
eukprot:366191-Pelagomonas_calceolata.AAC.1